MNDDDLRARFHQLRRHDARSAPPFVIRRARRVPVVIALAPLVAAAAALVLWCNVAPPAAPPRASRPTTPAPRAVVATMPLDFLLETRPLSGVHLDADPTEGLRP